MTGHPSCIVKPPALKSSPNSEKKQTRKNCKQLDLGTKKSKKHCDKRLEMINDKDGSSYANASQQENNGLSEKINFMMSE